MTGIPATTAHRLGAWARRLPPSAGGTTVLAVDGPSGSGKSTLADALCAASGATVVRMDDLYPGWDGLEDAVPNLVAWVLEPLARGERARYRRFDWVEDRYAEWHDVAAGGLLVVEGVASGSRACAPFLAAVVWIEAGRDERFRRGIERDGEAYRPHWERWARQELEHFAREGTRDRADVVLDGDRPAPGCAAGDGYVICGGSADLDGPDLDGPDLDGPDLGGPDLGGPDLSGPAPIPSGA